MVEPSSLQDPFRAEVDDHWVDLSKFPLIHLRIPERVTESDIVNVYKVLERRVLTRRVPYGVIVDVTRLRSVPDAALRKVLADCERSVADYEREYNKANAYVVPNTLLRGALTAVYWLAPPQYPHAVFPTVESAEAWVTEKLAAAGVTV